MEKGIRVKNFKSICGVMGCRSTETFFISKNGVNVNTPNICRDCIRAAYEVLFPALDTVEEAAPKTADKAADKAEKTLDGDAVTDEALWEAKAKKNRKKA